MEMAAETNASVALDARPHWHSVAIKTTCQIRLCARPHCQWHDQFVPLHKTPKMLGATLDLPAYLDRLQTETARLDQAALRKMADLIYGAWESDRFVYIFGNGGSGTTASHMAEDLGKSTLRPEDLKDESKKRLKVLSLTDNLGWIMAVGNDVSYEHIFLQQLMNYGRPG